MTGKNKEENIVEDKKEDVPLSFLDVLKYEANDQELIEANEKLYPKIDPSYFETHQEALPKKDDRNIVDKYNDLPIKPVIKNIDMNNTLPEEENKPKTFTIFGFEFKF